jgi:hypothetical protein
MLKATLLIAAIVDPLDLAHAQQQPSRFLGMAVKDIMLVGGIVLALALVLFLWAYWTRRDPRRNAAAGARVLYRSEKRAEGKVKVRRKRSRHPENLPRNPTLAEAGGLPPIRGKEEPAEPAC